MRIRSKRSWAATALGSGAIALACTGSLDVKTKADSSPSGAGSSGLAGASATGGTTPEEQMPQIPFEPVSARIYVEKVKNRLLGLPATEEEIAAVTADPATLKGMVDAWYVKPEAQAKLGNFFS
jgi:hypothetical protein